MAVVSVEADHRAGIVGNRQVGVDAARAVFPVGQIVGEGVINNEDDVFCLPCGVKAEKEAALPDRLPAMHQPTHSEYLDHCVTHCPYLV